MTNGTVLDWAGRGDPRSTGRRRSSATGGDIWEEQQTRGRPERRPKPRSHRPTASWVRRAEGRAETIDTPTVRRRVSQDQQAGDGDRFPTGVTSELPRKPRLAVVLEERVLAIREERLHFDHQNRPRLGMPGEHVDRPALTEFIERALGQAAPPEPFESPDDLVDEQRVGLVQKPIEVLAVPPHAKIERGSDSAADSVEPSEVDVLQRAALDLGDERSRNPCDNRDIGLAPGGSESQGPQPPTDSDAVHAAQAATSRLPADHRRTRYLTTTPTKIERGP